jgi:hypothetical protein
MRLRKIGPRTIVNLDRRPTGLDSVVTFTGEVAGAVRVFLESRATKWSAPTSEPGPIGSASDDGPWKPRIP